jgi:hypothetical protein
MVADPRIALGQLLVINIRTTVVKKEDLRISVARVARATDF